MNLCVYYSLPTQTWCTHNTQPVVSRCFRVGVNSAAGYTPLHTHTHTHTHTHMKGCYVTVYEFKLCVCVRESADWLLQHATGNSLHPPSHLSIFLVLHLLFHLFPSLMSSLPLLLHPHLLLLLPSISPSLMLHPPPRRPSIILTVLTVLTSLHLSFHPSIHPSILLFLPFSLMLDDPSIICLSILF